MDLLFEIKLKALADSIKSQINSECKINNNSIDEMHNLIKNDSKKYIYFPKNLKYIRHDKEYLVIGNKTFIMMIQETTKQIKQNSKFSGFINYIFQFIGQSDQQITDKLEDCRYPTPRQFFFAGKYLVKCYEFDQICSYSYFQLSFDIQEVKQENYPYVKILRILNNEHFIQIDQKVFFIYKEIVQYCINLTHLIIIQQYSKNKIPLKSIISILIECKQILTLELILSLNQYEKQNEIELLGQTISCCKNLNIFKYCLKSVPLSQEKLFNYIQYLSNLSYLDIFCFYKNFDIKYTSVLGDNFSKLMNLQILNLQLKTEKEGIIALSESIGKCKSLTKFKLILRNTYQIIGNKGFYAFQQGISQCTQLQSFYFDIGQNEITHNHFILIMKGIKCCKQLNTICILLNENIEILQGQDISYFEEVFRDLSFLQSLLINYENETFDQLQQIKRKAIKLANNLVIFDTKYQRRNVEFNI